MKIGAPKETFEAEARVAMTPDSALQVQKIGHTCFIEVGAGLAAGFSDAAYEAAGVTLVSTALGSPCCSLLISLSHWRISMR
jgi:H+-translocating NAD(P) transhydrogenase subunit alpha